jgi:hypothetical protein
MKTKSLLLSLGAFLTLGGIWVGRLAWRVHHQLVNLQVRNAPLVEVLRQVERQTWQKIRAEQNLDARITLNLVDKPLAHVLDRIAEQAGAEWSTKYAVFKSVQALNSLETALRGDGNLEAVGWTKIAPKTPAFPLARPDGGDLPAPGPNLQTRRLGPNSGTGVTVSATADVLAGPTDRPTRVAGTPSTGEGEPGPMTLRIVRNSGPGGTSAIEEVWTPKELVLESALRTRLGDHPAEAPTPAAAAETARTVNGRWTTFFAFRRSPFGVGTGFSNFHPPTPGLEHFMIKRGGGSSDSENHLESQERLPGPAPDFQELANRESNARFARLTPQQRVQAARQRLGLNQK